MQECAEMGASCSLVVGGIFEMFLQDERYEQLKLRKGFVREAIKNGLQLVRRTFLSSPRRGAMDDQGRYRGSVMREDLWKRTHLGSRKSVM
jgi:hypothetical protein